MIKVFSVTEMIAAEKAADIVGVSYATMMENAGKGVADAITARHNVEKKQVLVLVGPGNNGGDGLVAARYLAEAGAEVACYLLKERDAQSDENYALVQRLGLFTLLADFDQRFRVLRLRLKAADIIVDAMLGTGVSRPIEGMLAKVLKQVRQATADRHHAGLDAHDDLTSIVKLDPLPRTRPVMIAVDCPTGLNCDTGQLDPVTLPADMTVTFAGPKRGHFRFPGAGACGELVVVDIGIPPRLPAIQNVPIELITANEARHMLPSRPLDGHKGTFGKILIAAGSVKYRGAPFLCARGAYRAGAGLVALAVPKQIRPIVASQIPEATYPPVQDDDNLGATSAAYLIAHLEEYRAMLFGPGLDYAAPFVKKLLAATKLPTLVIDADGLNLLTRLPRWYQYLPPYSILTPHPGEMARMMELSLDEFKGRNRIAIVQEKATAWNHIVVLKGAYTVIGAPDGRCTILPFANPILGVAGSGDVLAGVIVALLGQGMKPYEAAVLGGYLHGAAGQLASETIGDSGLLASEIADYVPQVRQKLLEVREVAT